MKNKLFFLLSALILLIAGGCSDHIIQPVELANGRVIGSVHGIISDFGTHSIFEEGAVKVTWMNDGVLSSTMSDDLGYYYISGLSSGAYELTFWGSSDYSVSNFTINIPRMDEVVNNAPATDKDYEHNITLNVGLYKRDAGVSGFVIKTDTTAAVGVTVVADYTISLTGANQIDHSGGYNCYPGRYTALTNNNGFFSFDSLPSSPTVVLYTLPYTYNSIDYRMFYLEQPLVAGVTSKLDNDILLSVQ